MPRQTRSRRSVLYAVPYRTARRIEEIAHARGWQPYDILTYAVDALWLIYAAQSRRSAPPPLETTHHISALSGKALRRLRAHTGDPTP